MGGGGGKGRGSARPRGGDHVPGLQWTRGGLGGSVHTLRSRPALTEQVAALPPGLPRPPPSLPPEPRVRERPACAPTKARVRERRGRPHAPSPHPAFLFSRHQPSASRFPPSCTAWAGPQGKRRPPSTGRAAPGPLGGGGAPSRAERGRAGASGPRGAAVARPERRAEAGSGLRGEPSGSCGRGGRARRRGSSCRRSEARTRAAPAVP